MPNKWIIGNPPKIAPTYTDIQYTDGFFNDLVCNRPFRYQPVSEIDINTDTRHPLLLREIIANLPQIWPESVFLAYHMWMEIKDWRNVIETEITYDFDVLLLDKTKLGAWRLFQGAKFYQELPGDIRGEILQYIYRDMVFVRNFILYNNDIVVNPIDCVIKKIQEDGEEQSPQDKNGEIYKYIKHSCEYNAHFRIAQLPEYVPIYREIDYKLL